MLVLPASYGARCQDDWVTVYLTNLHMPPPPPWMHWQVNTQHNVDMTPVIAGSGQVFVASGEAVLALSGAP
jgi:hypothetical protein